jgi:hypothetical protein
MLLNKSVLPAGREPVLVLSGDISPADLMEHVSLSIPSTATWVVGAISLSLILQAQQ